MRSKIAVGGFRRQPLVDAEHRVERVVEPDARRRAAEQVVVRGERVPDLARVGLDRRRRRARGMPRSSSAHALAVQHAEHVVVGRDEAAPTRWRTARRRRTTAGRCGRAGSRSAGPSPSHRGGARGRASAASAGNSRSGWRFSGMAMSHAWRSDSARDGRLSRAARCRASVARVAVAEQRDRRCRAPPRETRGARPGRRRTPACRSRKPSAIAPGSPRASRAICANVAASGSATSMRAPCSSTPLA